MVIDPRAKWRGKQIKPEEFAFLPEETGSSLQMRPRIPMRGSVLPHVRLSLRLSVKPPKTTF